MDAYFPYPDSTEGPEVLFAWRDHETWRFGFGGGWRDTVEQTFTVGDARVHPECFAFVQPPRKR